MGKCWSQLKNDQRHKLSGMLKANVPVAKIAKEFGVSRQTIYREIKRGEFIKRNSDWTETKVYDPYVAERHYQNGLKERGRELKIGNDLQLLRFLSEQIKEYDRSPEAALAEIGRQGKHFKTDICKNTLYSYIKKGILLEVTPKDLPTKEKKKKKRREKVQKRAQAGDSISTRPEDIDSREEFGHWEMDTVVGPQGKSKCALLVLTERKSRKEIIRKMENRKTESVVKELDRLERKMGEKDFRNLFKTITVDNGSEFSDVEGLERSRRNKRKRTKLYYCHPYRSCERGSNECNNRFIRRKIPKGLNFDEMSRREIQEVEDWMNNYPRPMFAYATSQEIFEAELDKLSA